MKMTKFLGLSGTPSSYKALVLREGNIDNNDLNTNHMLYIKQIKSYKEFDKQALSD